jgi:hypothetical protein
MTKNILRLGEYLDVASKGEESPPLLLVSGLKFKNPLEKNKKGATANAVTP